MNQEQFVEALREEFGKQADAYQNKHEYMLGYLCSVEVVTRKSCMLMDRLDWVAVGGAMEEVNSEMLMKYPSLQGKFKISLNRSTSTNFNFEVKNRTL